jgi:hypothetical protein
MDAGNRVELAQQLDGLAGQRNHVRPAHLHAFAQE